MTTFPAYFAPLRIGDGLVDLGHLDPVRFGVPSEKLRRTITIRCLFSNHVFTRAFDPGLDPANVPVIMDGARSRVFCPDRYWLSRHLPMAVLELRDPRIYVRQTNARRNWLYVATIERAEAEAAGERSPRPVRYQLFFTLRKAVGEGSTREDVEMVVESAYAEHLARPPDLLGRVLFAGLVTATFEGRAIHTQPSRRR